MERHTIPKFTAKKVKLGNDQKTYKIVKKLGEGDFAEVFQVTKYHCDFYYKDLAVKCEFRYDSETQPNEWTVYKGMEDNCYGIPRPHYFGNQEADHQGPAGTFYIIAMQLLGPSLIDEMKTTKVIPLEKIASIAVEAIKILKHLHAKGFVHGDVKPENILLSPPSDLDDRKKLFLIDLGLASKWRSSSVPSEHIKEEQDVFRQTVEFASLHAHSGRKLNRRDDLISLGYTLVLLQTRILPWIKVEDENDIVCLKEEASTDPGKLTKYTSLRAYMSLVTNMGFDEEPDYPLLRSIFDSYVNPQVRFKPHDHKDIWKRRNPKEDERAKKARLDERAKKARLATPATQWILVCEARPGMKQMYHYNVADSRLRVHVEKGYECGLRVSCVASSADDLWAIIMESETGFHSQVYKVSSGVFFDKVWIKEQWDDGYYISSVAGTTRSSLVVMSKGKRHVQQCYKVGECFPVKWIMHRRREGFYVTSMTTAGSRWGVVMSRTVEFLKQVFKVHSLFPSEDIKILSDVGFRITSMAATADQVAIVLSSPRQKIEGNTQEALRTSVFPSTQVKEKWSKNHYIASMCNGLIVSAVL